jgi:hypothetical protein
VTDTYDLFKDDELGAPIWVEAVEGRHQVKKRLSKLKALRPGTYRIYDQAQRRFVEPFTQSAEA